MINVTSLKHKIHSAWFSERYQYPDLFGGKYPVVRVSLSEQVDVWALLDSGCDVSLLTSDFAPPLGISDVTSGVSTGVWGMSDDSNNSNSGLSGHRHENVNLNVQGKSISCPLIFLDNHIFAEVGIPLILGREGVFEQLGPILFYETNNSRSVYIA